MSTIQTHVCFIYLILQFNWLIDHCRDKNCDSKSTKWINFNFLFNSGFQKDPNGKYEIRMKGTAIQLVGEYNIKGKILILPIQGVGNSNITMGKHKHFPSFLCHESLLMILFSLLQLQLIQIFWSNLLENQLQEMTNFIYNHKISVCHSQWTSSYSIWPISSTVIKCWAIIWICSWTKIGRMFSQKFVIQFSMHLVRFSKMFWKMFFQKCRITIYSKTRSQRINLVRKF